VEQVRIAAGAAEGVLDRVLAGETIGTRMIGSVISTQETHHD